MHTIDPQKLEEALSLVRASGQFTVLDRFVAPDGYEVLDPDETRYTLMVVDVETTGLKAKEHKSIEIGYVLVEFTPDGRLGKVLERHKGFEDPGHPLEPETIRLTGITDEDVAGQRFDDETINAAVARAQLVVAHNAKLDRQFLELRFPAFQNKWWACSFREGPWADFEVGSQKLDYLAFKVAGVDFDGHRALNDAEVTLHLLSLKTPEGVSVLKLLLDSARTPTYHVWAVGAPFDRKDALKDDRKYYWSPEASPDGKELKAWHKDGLSAAAYLEEAEALKAIYPNPGSKIIVDVHTGWTRYSDRIGQRHNVAVGEMATLLPKPKAAPSPSP